MTNKVEKMNEELYKSFPTILPVQLHFYSLHDDVEGFRILLESDNGDVFKVQYNYAMMYRKSREGERFNSLGVLKSALDTESVIYKVRNSKFIEWFDLETLGANKYTEGELQHWAVISLDQWIDVLSYSLPEVTLLE